MSPEDHLVALRALELSTPPPAGVVRMADVDPVEVEWVWHPYISRGKLTLLEGDPGQGKSWIALGIAAALRQIRPRCSCGSASVAKYPWTTWDIAHLLDD